MIPEMVLAWIAIAAYAVSVVAFTGGFFYERPRVLAAAVRIATFGVFMHAAAIGARWVRVGHGPYLGFYEVASLLAFVSVAGLLWLQRTYPGLRAAGVAVMPVALLMMGATLLVSPEAQEVGGSLVSFWLAIHVLFANLAYGSYLGAFALALAFLISESQHAQRWSAILDRLPGVAELDTLTFRLVGSGFLFQGVMIATGAVWANEAWGRYWAWDPMETWSLVAWAVYAVYLHLTMTMGWRGKRAAWVLVIALPVIVFSLLGVPVIYDSIHGAYLSV